MDYPPHHQVLDENEVKKFIRSIISTIESKARDSVVKELIDWISSEYRSEHYDDECVSPRILIKKLLSLTPSKEE